MFSPPLLNAPVHGPNTLTSAGIEYAARSVVSSTPLTKMRSKEHMKVSCGCLAAKSGNSYSTPSERRQLAKSMAEALWFNISMNSGLSSFG